MFKTILLIIAFVVCVSFAFYLGYKEAEMELTHKLKCEIYKRQNQDANFVLHLIIRILEGKSND